MAFLTSIFLFFFNILFNVNIISVNKFNTCFVNNIRFFNIICCLATILKSVYNFYFILNVAYNFEYMYVCTHLYLYIYIYWYNNKSLCNKRLFMYIINCLFIFFFLFYFIVFLWNSWKKSVFGFDLRFCIFLA